MRIVQIVSAVIASTLLLGSSATAALVKTKHVEADLVAQTLTAAPGETLNVALHQKIIPGWHTYWRNPGDAGEATSLTWTVPSGWKAGEIIWPAPEHFLSGPLMNYVFSDEVWLATPISVPADAKPGQTVILKANAQWLVCKEVCVPEEATFTLPVKVATVSPTLDPRFGKAIAATIAGAPRPAGLKATFSAKGTVLTLSVAGAALKGEPVKAAWFYPYDGAVIDHAKPQTAKAGKEGVGLTLTAGYNFTHNKPPAKIAGVLVLGPGKAWEVEALPGAPIKGAEGGAVVGAADTPPSGGGDNSGLGLLGALGAALVGGLILNLMPCVFPVLSIKAAQLARHVESPAHARAEGLVFMLGTVATFVALAAALIAAQAAGQAVGWGFQLQSPTVVAVLALLMLAVGLNMSGVFEIGLSAQGAGQGLASKSGLVGSFFTGALAVVVAAPCTAPFMAGAIGWALVQPPIAALSVFVALGIGLALPFTALTFAPSLFKRLPKPGAWMEGLKKTLAFPMYGAAAWLAWVFVQQAGANGLALLFAAAVVIAFAVWVFGVSQRSARPLTPRLIAGVAVALAIPLIVTGSGFQATAASGDASPVAGIASQPWSPATVETLRAAGKPVFVDFTAAWCVTCQVNERTALATAGVAAAFRRTGAVYLKADWTNRNAEIAHALAEQGRQGVPLYLLYDAHGTAAPAVLPQILTEGGVVSALDAAARRG